MPPAQTRAVIEGELGAPLEEVFNWIDMKPIGSASISQVCGQDLSPEVQTAHGAARVEFASCHRNPYQQSIYWVMGLVAVMF